MCDWDWCNKPGVYNCYDANNECKVLCYDCAKSIMKDAPMVFYNWELFTADNINIVNCPGCWAAIHREQLINQWNCNQCIYRRNQWTSHPAHYCTECWCMHTWLCLWWLSSAKAEDRSHIRFTVRNDSKNWSARWESKDNSKYIRKIWQFQIEREITKKAQELLTKFYHWYQTFTHYYTREPVRIEWEVSYYNYRALNDVYNDIDMLKRWYDSNVIKWKQISKYFNHFLQWIDGDGLIKWKYVDPLGNIKDKSESINKFFKDVWRDVTNQQMIWKFKYILSSDIEHKIKAFTLNSSVHSCQKSSNCDSYARWAYDAITNWCNCPILIYNIDSDVPFARITTRIMYDENGQEYILIDRVYHNWEFSDTTMKWTIYKAIVQDLKDKWFKVIASNYSAHDNSTYSYLASLWLKSDKVVTDLCQPLRRLVNGCGYYCDWWTEVLRWEIDWLSRATDYLDKAYLL